MRKTIVILGAGLAGLSAALQAVKNECEVKLISSMPSERAQSVMAEGGINAALDTKGENDSPLQHYLDTVKAGCNLANPNAVWNMTQAAPKLIQDLYKMGVQFNVTEDGELDLRPFGGQKKRRTAFAKSDTGKQLMTALIDEVRKWEAKGKIERFNHHDFVTLLKKENTCYGCVVWDRYTREEQNIAGNAVIIATGGMHGLFSNTTGSLANTGEAVAELFRLGVPMANLEMIQYHPTTVEIGGKRMLISEAARGEGGRLFSYKEDSKKRWYFMEEKYPELGNLMPRDITAREIWKVGQNNKVYLDMTEISEEEIEKKLAGLREDCLIYLHKDICKEPIEVSPGIHYFMGGIYVDEKHRTGIKNLYAAGECCAQYHGANRLGGNSLLGAIYGGQVAVQTAVDEISNRDEKENVLENFGYENREGILQKASMKASPQAMTQAALKEIMQQAMAVVRKESTLKEAEKKLYKMEGCDEGFLLLSQAMLESALARQESRGAHWREDYPKQRDDKFLKTTVARYDGTRISIAFEEIPERR